MKTINHDFVEVDNVTIHLAHYGSDSGKLMLFLHGYPENWYAWKKQLLYFGSKGFKAVAIDQRGYNRSSKPKYIHDFRIDVLAIDIFKIIRHHFNRKTAIVIGHDWGANVAWWTALRFPQIVEKLIIINVPHPLVMKKTMNNNFRQMLSSWYIYFYQIPIIPELIMSFNHGLLLASMITSSANKNAFDRKTISYYRNSWSKATVTSMINWYRGMKLGSDKKLRSIKVKPEVLVLWGLNDRFIRKENIKPSLNLCKNATCKVYPNNTHWVIHEAGDKVNKKIFTFISN